MKEEGESGSFPQMIGSSPSHKRDRMQGEKDVCLGGKRNMVSFFFIVIKVKSIRNTTGE